MGNYKDVMIGLEIHTQLTALKSKLFYLTNQNT